MIMEILSFYNGSAEDQQQLADDLERLEDHQQLALRVYLEYDDSLLNYSSLRDAVELAEEAFQGQYNSGGDFAAELMADIEGKAFIETIEKLMGYAAWQRVWEYNLCWAYEYVEVDDVGHVVRQM